MDIYQPFADVYLCTLDQLKTYAFNSNGATFSDDDDTTLVFFLRDASELVVNEILRVLPLPFTATILFDAPYAYRDGKPSHYELSDYYRLRLDDVAPCLSVTTLTNGDSTTISSSNYALYPANSQPKRQLRLKQSANIQFELDSNDDFEQVISVAGMWGYVPHYATAWQDSGKDVPAGGLTASATTFTFSTASDAGQFSAGDYIRIDSEVLCVTDSNSTTGVVTVVRGALGSTATTHDAATDIEQYQHHRQILSVTAMLAYSLYNKDRSNYNTDDATVTEDALINRARRKLINHINWVRGDDLY